LIAIPEKCYTCRKRIGYIITNTDETLFREAVVMYGLFQQCEECFVEGKLVTPLLK